MVSPWPVGTMSKLPLSFCDISKLCSKFTWQLDGNWTDHWGTYFHHRFASFSPPPPPAPTPRQGLLLLFTLPLLSCSLHCLDKPFARIGYCRREMSHCFQPSSQPSTATSFLFALSNSSDFPWPLTVTRVQRHLFPVSLWPEKNLLL